MNCKNCHKALNQSVFNANRSKKSCPKCSQANGSVHVFYDYPSAFGITSKRVTKKNPDGPQSYCTSCRGSQTPQAQSYLCNTVI